MTMMRQSGAIEREIGWIWAQLSSPPHLHKTLQAVTEVLGTAQHPTVNEVPLLPKLLQHDAEGITLVQRDRLASGWRLLWKGSGLFAASRATRCNARSAGDIQIRMLQVRSG